MQVFIKKKFKICSGYQLFFYQVLSMYNDLHVLLWPKSWSRLPIFFHVCVLDLYFKLIKVNCLISELTVRLSCYLWNVWTWSLYFKLTKVLCLISTSLIYNLPVSSVENYWDYLTMEQSQDLVPYGIEYSGIW